MNVSSTRAPIAIDSLAQLRKRYVQIIALMLLVALTPIWTLLVFSNTNRASINLLLIFISPLFYLINYILARRNYINVATIMLLVLLCVSALFATNNGGEVFYGVITVATAAIIADRFLYVVVNFFIISKIAFTLIREIEATGRALAPSINTSLILLATVVILSLVLRYFFNMMLNILAESRRNASLLSTTAEIGGVTAGIMNPDDLLKRAVEYIRDRFGYYYVQVFLMDENSTELTLTAATGEAGAALLRETYSIKPNNVQGFSTVLESGSPVIIHDMDQRVYFRRKDVQPHSRSEVLLPINDGEKLIGVLDVQSLRSKAFGLNDTQALQIMANQLGASVRTARLFDAQKRAVQENKRLFLEAEANLREIRRLNRQLTKEGWADYLAEKPAVHGVNLAENQIISDDQWTESLVEAATRRRAISHSDGDSKTIAVPILLRGEVLGAIEIEPGGDTHEQDTVEMVQAVAQRLATSLESARLFEETQEATMQEQRINEIAAQYQQATTVDDLLRITLKELSRSLGAQRGAIRLGALGQTADAANGSGDHGQGGQA